MANRVQHQLLESAARLREAGVDTPLLDAQLLLARVLGCGRLDLIAHPESELTEPQLHAYTSLVDQRAARVPLAYILGTREFFGLEIEVRPGVLVPRPETELLVEECLKRVRAERPTIADIGAGSGAIAVAVAVRMPSATVYATDLSPIALEVSRANAERHGVADRVKLLAGDLVEPLRELAGEFDAILSNPPYIPSGDISALEPEVSVHEPREALDGGPDGLEVYRRLLPDAIGLLREGGFTAVEVGAGQASDVAEIARGARCSRTECVRDLAGIERVVVAYR